MGLRQTLVHERIHREEWWEGGRPHWFGRMKGTGNGSMGITI
jgi:hypothetical protein